MRWPCRNVKRDAARDRADDHARGVHGVVGDDAVSSRRADEAS